MPHIEIGHAATLLYAARGNFTMRALGKQLGVCASALYRHYRNKDAIIDAVVEAAEKRLAFRLRPSARLKGPKDRAGFMAERALLFSVEQPHLFQLVTRRKPSRCGDDGGERAQLMRSELRKAIDEKQLKDDDIEAVHTALWAELCGLVALRQRGDFPADGPPLQAAWFGTAHRMLRGLRAA